MDMLAMNSSVTPLAPGVQAKRPFRWVAWDAARLCAPPYILSSANWDPYPMANEVEAFANAVANMDAAIAQRIERFSDRGPTPFFTGIYPKEVLTAEQLRLSPALTEPYFAFMDVWSEIQNDDHGVTPEGNASDFGVADIEAYSRLKGARGREVVDLTMQLLIAQGRLCRRRMAN
jgi:histidine ammonia-lyase